MIVDSIVERKWDSMGKLNKHSNLDVIHFREYLGSIALKIYQSDSGFITRDELMKMSETKRFISYNLGEDEYQDIGDVLVLFYFEKKIQKPEEHNSGFVFAHKSIQEFLAAEKIWRTFLSLLTDKRIEDNSYVINSWFEVLKLSWQLFSPKLLSSEVIYYLAEIIKNDKINRKKDEVAKRMNYFLPSLVAKQFLWKFDAEIDHGKPFEKAYASFTGYWSILSNLDLQKYSVSENEIRSIEAYLSGQRNAESESNNQKGENIKSGILELKGLIDLQTAFIQYWNFFDEYIESTKGVRLNFNVKKHPLGLLLEIEISNEVPLEEVERYMSEYALYLNERIIDVKNKFTRDALEKEIELLGLQMRQQKSNFERQIDILTTANRILEGDKGRLFRLIENYSNKPQYLELNQNVSQKQSHVNVSTIKNININIYEVQYNFSNLVFELKKHDIFNDLNFEDAYTIQEELDQIEDSSPDLNINTSTKSKINRFFRSLIDKVKDSKAILIDMPAVVSVLYLSMTTFIDFLSKFGNDFDKTIESLNEAISILSQFI